MLSDPQNKHLLLNHSRLERHASSIRMVKIISRWVKRNDLGTKEPILSASFTRAERKTLKKVKCFNCNKKGHFACDWVCPEPFNYDLFVSSCWFLTESKPVWIIGSRAATNVMRDHEAHIDFCRVPLGSRWIYVEHNSKAEVHGIGTSQLMLRSGCTLLLHDNLYTP